MALGTPIAGTVAYSASGGTSVSPAYPAGITANTAILLIVGQKPSTANGGTVTTPTGWTLQDALTGAGGYGTTLGADTGNTNLRIYSKDVVLGTETGTLPVTLGTNGVSWAFMVHIPTGGGALEYGSADGSRTTAPTANTPFAVALTNGASATNFQAGDKAIWAMCIPSDVTTPSQFSAQSVTATGATFDAAVEFNEPDSATGNDIGGYSAYAHVASGSSTAAPSVTVTAAGTVTNVRGPVVMVRVREIAGATQDLTPSLYTNTSEFFSATVSQVAPAQDLTPALYTNTNSFFSATADAANTLVPVRYDNISVFYAPSITQIGPDQTLTAARYDSLNVFYSLLLEQSGGSQTVNPELLTNTQTFYTPAVTATRALAASLFANSQTFYGPSATNINIIAPSMFADSDFIFPPVVTQPGAPQVLTASLFTNTNTFFTPTVVDPPAQPILGSGSIVRPRKKFRPAILFDFEEPEIVLPDASAKAVIGNFSVTVELGSVIGTSPDPINSRTSLAFTQIETYMLGVRAESSWNDPSDDELLFILDFALD